MHVDQPCLLPTMGKCLWSAIRCGGGWPPWLLQPAVLAHRLDWPSLGIYGTRLPTSQVEPMLIPLILTRLDRQHGHTCLSMSCWNRRFKMEALTIVNGIVVQYELRIYLWWKSKVVLGKRQWKNSPRTKNTEIRLGLPNAIFLHLDIGGSGEDCALTIVMSLDECSHLLELGSPGKTPAHRQVWHVLDQICIFTLILSCFDYGIWKHFYIFDEPSATHNKEMDLTKWNLHIPIHKPEPSSSWVLYLSP